MPASSFTILYSGAIIFGINGGKVVDADPHMGGRDWVHCVTAYIVLSSIFLVRRESKRILR